MYYVELIFKIICVLVVVRTMFRKLLTIFYISIRYCHDGTRVPERLNYPDNYIHNKTTWGDKFNTQMYKMFPDVRDYTDFRLEPMPYLLSDGVRIPMYLRRIFLSQSIILGFCYFALTGWLDKYIPIILICMLSSMNLFAILTMVARKVRSVELWVWRTIKFINLRPNQIIHALSLGVLYPGKKFNGRVVLPLMILSYAGIVALYRYFV